METWNNNTTESEKEKLDKDILKDPELLRHLYHVKLLSFSKIANKIGCNPSTVFKAFKKYGIQHARTARVHGYLWKYANLLIGQY